MSDHPNRFFSAPGLCANCGEQVGLGRSHVEWASENDGYWTCSPPEPFHPKPIDAKRREQT